MVTCKPVDTGLDLPAEAFRLTRQILCRRTAQSSARRQKRDRLEHIGLAGTIWTNKHKGAAIKRQARGAVAAEMRQAQGFDRQTAQRTSLSEQSFGDQVRPASA